VTGSDGFAQETLAEKRSQDVTNAGHGQNKTQVGPTQKGHAREKPQNQKRNAQSDKRIQHGAQISKRIKCDHFRNVAHAPGEREIAEGVQENDRENQNQDFQL